MESSTRLKYSRIIFITGIVLLTSLSALFLYETQQKNASSTFVYHSTIIRQSLERILLTFKERESSQRAYLLTKDSAYSQKGESPKLFTAHFQSIDSLLADNPLQRENLKRLKEHCKAHMLLQDSILENAKNATPSDVNSMMQFEATKLDTIRNLIASMQNIETQASKDHELDGQKHTLFAMLIGVAASIFSIIVFILAFFFIDQELKRSQLHVSETQILHAKVAQINVELEEANQSLLKLNRELGSKNIQLERYAKELGSFTHITSHDMQEPLRKIEFFISLIQDREMENLTDEGKKTLDKIRQSVLRMRKLFLSMVEFSLTNSVENTVEEFDLNEVLNLTLDSLKIYIKDSNAIIESDHLPRVKGIKYQLLQFFENIISNAIKFRRREVLPEIQIACEIIDPANYAIAGLRNDTKYYKIDFQDNGTGFDPKYSEKIFEIFQRLSPRNDSYGVGIGLAICRRIAENHGGILVAHSQSNAGSVFSFYIPALIK